jgi:hypothetical protein
MAVDILSRVLGGELAGAGEIEEKRVVVADFVVVKIIPYMPWLCGETTNAVSISNLEDWYCPVFMISSWMEIIAAPAMFRASIFEDCFIYFLVFQI